jgi:GNAT superfamily N-acetyltransferase
MIIGIDKVADVADKLDDCLNHYGTRDRVDDQIGLQRVKWSTYEQLEKEGIILLLTANDEGKLAGFALYIVYVHPNHPDAKIGHCQFLIVPPTYRRHGLGRRLIECAETELKKQHCTHIMHGRRMVYDVEPLFPKLGFEKFEESYIKELK